MTLTGLNQSSATPNRFFSTPQNETPQRGVIMARPRKPEKLNNPPTIRCPSWLPDHAKAVWRRLYPLVKDVTVNIDETALATLCVAIAHAQEATRKIEEEGMIRISQNRNGGTYEQISPWFTILHKSLDQITKIGSRFGLTPSDRAALVNLPNNQRDELDEIFGD